MDDKIDNAENNNDDIIVGAIASGGGMGTTRDILLSVCCFVMSFFRVFCVELCCCKANGQGPCYRCLTMARGRRRELGIDHIKLIEKWQCFPLPLFVVR